MHPSQKSVHPPPRAVARGDVLRSCGILFQTFMRASSLVALLLCALPAITATALGQQPALVTEPDHAVPDSRRGERQSFRIASSILNETRRIHVALPASFRHSAPDRRYPVTVVLDGEASFGPAATVSDELSRNGQIPEAIVVAIENTDRLRDLTPPGLSVSGSSLTEGGDRFLDFIERELLPAVDRQFRGGAPRTFVGHSSGGVLVTYAAATRSAFRGFVSLDAPIHLGEDWLAKKLTASARAAKAPVRYVSFDRRFGWPDAAWRALTAAAPATWRLHREKLGRQESHESLPMLGMYLGLREVFADYSMMAAPESPTTSILPYYAAVSASLGASVAPPRKLLMNVVDDLLMEGRGVAAGAAYRTLASSYGAPADSVALSSRIADAERQPPPTETVEGLLATPFPTPAQARSYLGDWIGDEWISPDEPRTNRQTLRIRVDNGRVIGETLYRDAPPGYGVRRWEYLRITPTGMTFGFMNGMRPRGVLLFEGVRKGDALTGTVRFGGINFVPPPEMSVRHEFAYTRRRR